MHGKWRPEKQTNEKEGRGQNQTHHFVIFRHATNDLVEAVETDVWAQKTPPFA
ncbi:hypothetical protein [Alkalicoccus luteus]|uniref:hypothetical protein n=1 Tax=Alkalicoccus luteus TaxID=1237094 RepID=UPI004034DE51